MENILEQEMIEIFEVYDLILSPDCPVFLYFMFGNQQSSTTINGFSLKKSDDKVVKLVSV